MNKTIVFECSEINLVCPWKTVNPFLDEIRKLGEKVGIKVPNRIRYGGDDKRIWIECSKKMVEIVIKVVEGKNKKVLDVF